MSAHEEDEGIVIYGVHPVEEYLEAAPERVERLMVSHGREDITRIEELARLASVRIERVSEEDLDAVAGGGNHQGVAVEGMPFRYADLDEVLGGLEGAARTMVVILDQVQDPGNLGAILRSAAAFGADAVVIPKDRAASVTAAVIRSSAGQALKVPVARVTNLTRTLKQLKEERFWAVETTVASEQTQAPWAIDLESTRVALVLGGEHGGVRRLVGETCDFHASIPMAQGVESLNVASAATTMMYEIRRQWSQEDS